MMWIRFIVVVLTASLWHVPAYGFDPESSCVRCHGDREKMQHLGYPQMYLDPARVDEEAAMGGVPTCVDCHLGNSAAMEAEEAHRGMPRPFYAAIGKTLKYEAVGREVTDFAPIQPRGENRTRLLLRQSTEEAAKEKNIKKLLQLFYHDTDPETMAYTPEVARKTCGKCHGEETEGYNASGMGLNRYQRGFLSWTSAPPGPHNCGAWFGDNYDRIAAEANGEFTSAMNDGLARGCNKCHSGCNDCHYEGFTPSEARHVFNRQPPNLSCAGSGRGTICHSGPMDRRRGSGFMRGEFAFPQGELPPDVHEQNGIRCVDCHRMKNHSYGHLAQGVAHQACRECHPAIVEALESSQHASVDCSSCHIQAVGAYQFTFWGPGISEGQKNLFSKHKEYYGVRNLPTLIRHPETGRWIPVKPYPMAVLNIEPEVEKGKLTARSIPRTEVQGNQRIGEPATFTVERKAHEVNDFYILTGTSSRLGENDRMLGWIQIDKMSHALGEGRSCTSCHASSEQVSTSWFTYSNPNDVQKPFSGAYTLRATKEGLFFSEFTTSEIEPVKGRNVADFAPFAVPEVTENVWNVKGEDYSLPFDPEVFTEHHHLTLRLSAELNRLKSEATDSEGRQRLEQIEAILPHNQERAEKMLLRIGSGTSDKADSGGGE